MLNFDVSKFLKNAKATTSVPSSNAVIAPKEMHEIDNRTSLHMQHQKVVPHHDRKPEKNNIQKRMFRDKTHKQNRGAAYIYGDERAAKGV
jgi:hypothetical protein